MYPTLLHFEVAGRTVVLHAYPTMLVLAGLTAVTAATLTAGRLGMPAARASAAFAAALVGAVVGARLLHAATNLDLYTAEPSRLWALDATGFALYGGLLVGGAAGLLTARALGLGLWAFADAGAAGGAVGVVFNRVGCFLQGCCYGRPTDLPWGVEFPPGSPAWVRQMVDGPPDGGGSPLLSGLLGGSRLEPGPVHPTQLYELAAALVALAVVLALVRRRAVPGVAFASAALWFTAFRLLNSGLRWPPGTLTAPAWFYPGLYLVLLAGLTAALLRRSGDRGSEGAPGTAPRRSGGLGIGEGTTLRGGHHP